MNDAIEIIEEKEDLKLPSPRVVSQEDLALMPVMNMGVAKRRYKELVTFVKGLMVEDRDFGTIPGTAKPTLYKPGAEKLTTFFGLSKEFEIVNEIEDWDRPLFYYRYRSRVTAMGPIRHYWTSETNGPRWHSLCGLKRHVQNLKRRTWLTGRDCFSCGHSAGPGGDDERMKS